MRMARPGSKIVRYFLVAGFVIPCLLSAVVFVGDVKVEGGWKWILLIPWPASVLLMSADGTTAGNLLAFSISAGANVLVYWLVGGAVSFCYRRFFLRSA
jgi:hypothetical protein